MKLLVPMMSAAAIALAPTAAAEPIQIDLSRPVCQMLAKGLTVDQVAGELEATFSDFAARTGQSRSRAEWRSYVTDLALKNCPM